MSIIQDWEEVRFSNNHLSNKNQNLKEARSQGLLDTQKKYGAGNNKQTILTSNFARIEEDTETFQSNTVSFQLKKIISQARLKAGLSQKDLAAKCNLKSTVIHDYETGKAIPNSTILGKIERALKSTDPEFVLGTLTKAQKKKNEVKNDIKAQSTVQKQQAKRTQARSRRF